MIYAITNVLVNEPKTIFGKKIKLPRPPNPFNMFINIFNKIGARNINLIPTALLLKYAARPLQTPPIILPAGLRNNLLPAYPSTSLAGNTIHKMIYAINPKPKPPNVIMANNILTIAGSTFRYAAIPLHTPPINLSLVSLYKPRFVFGGSCDCVDC